MQHGAKRAATPAKNEAINDAPTSKSIERIVIKFILPKQTLRNYEPRPV